MARIVVIGAGVGGLGTALCAARTGHSVTVVERDDTPLPADPHGAFEWDRRGAPQVRHSHAFLARLRNLLRDRHPDVLAALLAAGATEMRFTEMAPEGMDITPEPGDEDLVGIAVRRTTFEWVLRRLASAEGDVELVHGTAAEALRTVRDPLGPGTPRVIGVELADGSTVDADVVVAAGGRRNDVPALLAPHGITVAETTDDTGIVYLSRFFRLVDGAELPPRSGVIGGDLGYLKYGVFPGDNRTFSITFAVGTHDSELRKALLDDDTFITAASLIVPTAPYVDGRSEPITGVEVMGGLINRSRRFLDDDGRPVVLGLHAVGDAHTATNPLYGRGCSLAMVQAQLLADLLDEPLTDHDPDSAHEGVAAAHVARAIAYEAAVESEITPWYRAAVTQDRFARQAEGTAPDDAGPDGTVDPSDFVRELLRDGLLPAMRTDPVVLRAFLRTFNLLNPPDSLMNDPDLIGRVMTAYQDRDNRPPEPEMGPDRAGFFTAIRAPRHPPASRHV